MFDQHRARKTHTTELDLQMHLQCPDYYSRC